MKQTNTKTDRQMTKLEKIISQLSEKGYTEVYYDSLGMNSRNYSGARVINPTTGDVFSLSNRGGVGGMGSGLSRKQIREESKRLKAVLNS